MASTDKHLKNRELLLLVADAAGGTLAGRTIAQKLLYFAGLSIGQPTGHTAYFYGPYSDELTDTLNRAVLANELTEQVELISDWRGGPDASKHTYTLTERGTQEAAAISEAHPEEADHISTTVSAIAEAVPGFRQKTLSAAAKIHLIVSEQDRALTRDELRQLAQELGWRLATTEVNEAVDILSRLNLVTIEAA
jgi:uncharacterized protein YwgA